MKLSNSNMSLLAEPRRKQRISVDPQNLQWGNDESRFGKCMMERMGWQGGGLGKAESGRRDNLKLKANYTQKGLGADKNANAHWVAHHDDFARLLAELNEKKNGKPANEKEEEQSKSPQSRKSKKYSFEERSRNSRARIHYHRYVRSKDVKGYTSEQKAAIFGGGNINDAVKILDDNLEQKSSGFVEKKKKRKRKILAAVDMEETEPISDEMIINKEENIKTSSMTMDKYFAQKMAEMAKKAAIANEEGNQMHEEVEMKKKCKTKK